MYPNYTKAFLNLEGVFIKKVVQADSFIKIFIQSQPVEQTCPCCGAKTKRIHDYRLQEVQGHSLTGKTSNPAPSQTPLPLPILPQTVHGTLFVPPQLPPQDPQTGILHCLPAPADLFLKTDRRAYRCFRPDGLPPSGHDLLSSA